MSEFVVKIRKVLEVEDHPQADRLSINTVDGFKCISNKLEDGSARYKKGDYVVYIPAQSILPQWLLEKLGFWDYDKQEGTLSGAGKNRVKEIRLRGVFSEGIIFPVYQESTNLFKVSTHNGQIICFYEDNIADKLGIEKYTPAIPTNMNGLVYAYDYPHKYDFDNIKSAPNEFEDGEFVSITEKLHGTHVQFHILHENLVKDLDALKYMKEFKYQDSELVKSKYYITCCSKGLGSKGLFFQYNPDNDSNLYVMMMNKLFDNPSKNRDLIECFVGKDRIVILGEIFGKGVQDLNYSSEKAFKFFDVVVGTDNRAMYATENEKNYLSHTNHPALDRVPLLYTGEYSKNLIDLYTSDVSDIDAKTIKEGIVITGYTNVYARFEYFVPIQDVKTQKSISEDYLLRKNATEYQ